MKKIIKDKKYIIFALILVMAIVSIVIYNNSRVIDIPDEEIALAGGVTPQMFGAVGDGKTNDSKAFQAAIDFVSKSDKYNTLYIPEGTYSVRNLRLKKNVSLIGEGEKSILLADPSSKTWDGILYVSGLDSVSISNLTFDGNKPIIPGNTQEGTVNIWIVSSKNINISNCTFQNNYFLGICVKKSDTIVIDNNKFIDLDCGVITTDKPSDNLTITNNYFDGAEYSEPISIFALGEGYHHNIIITDNIIKNHTQGSGILLRAVKDVIVRNNKIDNCGTGIFCTASKYNKTEYGVYNATIEDNIITNTIYEGILLTNINDSKIRNNIIENAGSYGLLTKKVNNTIIEKNLFSEINTAGRPYHGFTMTITGMINSSVVNNTIEIYDQTTSADRSPIAIGSINGSTSTSSDNLFSDNKVSPVVSSLYREDKRFSINNNYALLGDENFEQ